MTLSRSAFLAMVLVLDLVAAAAIGIITGLPAVVTVTALLMRFVVLGIALGGLLKLSAWFWPLRPSNTSQLAAVSGLCYVLSPFLMWALMNNKGRSVMSVYFDLHTDFELFVFVCLPFLLAAAIGLIGIRALTAWLSP